MRSHLMLVSLLVATISCDTGRATDTGSTIINVIVRDDRGVPVDRMPVSATLSTGTSVDASTKTDGTAQLRVPDGGTYLVRVVPRAGYVGSTPGLSRSVSVELNSLATVDFTVYRQGVSTGDPGPEN